MITGIYLYLSQMEGFFPAIDEGIADPPHRNLATSPLVGSGLVYDLSLPIFKQSSNPSTVVDRIKMKVEIKKIVPAKDKNSLLFLYSNLNLAMAGIEIHLPD